MGVITFLRWVLLLLLLGCARSPSVPHSRAAQLSHVRVFCWHVRRASPRTAKAYVGRETESTNELGWRTKHYNSLRERFYRSCTLNDDRSVASTLDISSTTTKPATSSPRRKSETQPLPPAGSHLHCHKCRRQRLPGW